MDNKEVMLIGSSTGTAASMLYEGLRLFSGAGGGIHPDGGVGQQAGSDVFSEAAPEYCYGSDAHCDEAGRLHRLRNT